MRVFSLLVLALATIGATGAKEPLQIALAHGDVRERQTRTQLKRLLAHYDLGKWIYTRSIVIDDQTTPHSDPVLTLHARHLKDDDLLLSTFVHEQMHRFLAVEPHEPVEQAEAELRALYPNIPVGFPEGDSDEAGNDEHLVVIWLEYRADVELLGELRAREVMEFWANDHYTWIYRTMLDRAARMKIGAIIQAHDLTPGAHRP
jgi:hypothetical protein